MWASELGWLVGKTFLLFFAFPVLVQSAQSISLSITPTQTAAWRKQIFEQLSARTKREMDNFMHYEQAVEQVCDAIYLWSLAYPFLLSLQIFMSACLIHLASLIYLHHSWCGWRKEPCSGGKTGSHTSGLMFILPWSSSQDLRATRTASSLSTTTFMKRKRCVCVVAGAHA